MKNKGKITKVTEIAPKIKEIKSEKKEESELEKEVEEFSKTTDSEPIDFAPSGKLQSSVLSSDAPDQETPQERPVEPKKREDNDPGFSQSRAYDTSRRQNISQSTYETAEQRTRRINPSLTQSNILPSRDILPQFSPNRENISPIGQRNDLPERKYDDLMEKADKPRKRYPWEA